MVRTLPQSESRSFTWVTFAPQVASVLSIFTACLVLLGWELDIVSLRNVLPGQPQMVPNTALALILASISLWLSRTEEVVERRGQAALLCAGAVMLVSLLTLCEYLLRLDLGIDQVLFRSKLQVGGPSFPGRSSPHTAANF